MAKSLLFTFLLFSIALPAYSQPAIPKDVNSLYKLLVESKADTGRVKLLIKICLYDNANSAQTPALVDSALAAAARADVLAERLNYPEGIGLSFQMMAQAWCNKKHFQKADGLLKKAIGIFLKNNLYRDAAEAYLNIEQFYNAAGGTDYQVRINAFEHAQPLFHKAGAFDREGATLTILGDFYQLIDDLDSALNRLNRALIAYKAAKYPNLQSTYDLLGNVNMRKSRFQEALKYGLLAEKTAIAVKDTGMVLCTIYNRLGETYFVINKPEQAGIYFKKGIEIARKYHDDESMHMVMISLVSVLQSEKKFNEGLSLLKKIRQISAPTSEWTKYFYSISLDIYTDQKNLAFARDYADSLLTRSDIFSIETTGSVYAYNTLTKYLTQSGQFSKADKYLPAYRRLAVKFSMKRDEYRAYLRSFQADSARADYLSAINNYRRYFLLRDSLYDVAKTGQLDELKIKYETDKNEQSIASLKKTSVLQQESIKRADSIRNITIGASLILLVFVALLYKSRRLNKQNSEAISKKNLALNQLVAEKEWLLKEIHHRVKNNLQIVMGLLQRQSAYIKNDEALAAMQNSENRMHSIALIHQKLYQSENLDLICMQEYIDEMISYLKDSCVLESRIIFEKQLDDLYLDVSQAVPLGLILNEAITNAIKYAYKANETGTIYISLLSKGNGYNQLTIADNGPGLPAGFNKVESLGMNLMRGLTKQLGGIFEIISEQGCIIKIDFKTEIFDRGTREAEITLT